MPSDTHAELLLLLAAGILFAYGIIPHKIPGLIDRLFKSDRIIAMLYLISIVLSPALFAFPVRFLFDRHGVPFSSAIGLLAGYLMYLTQRMNTTPDVKKSVAKD